MTDKRRKHGLDYLILGAHLGLVAAVCAALAMLDIPLAARLVIIGVAVLPLLATLPGLLANRSTVLPWLALTLVGFVGFGSVEVIATRSVEASLVMLLSLLELGLLLILPRRSRPR